MTWQPIETAPKDETPILAWGPCWPWPEIISWEPEQKLWQEGYIGGDYADAGWEPTHWMPLPDAPSAAE